MIQRLNKDDLTKMETDSVHILLCGHSTGHIAVVVEELKPIHVELLTSEELFQGARELLQNLEVNSKSVTCIPAFTEAALNEGICEIVTRYKLLQAEFPGKEIYFGITGGTNVMVLEAAMSALAVGAIMHYVLRRQPSESGENQVLLFDAKKVRTLLESYSDSKRGI